TMVIDYQPLAKAGTPGSRLTAGAPKPLPASATQAAPLVPAAAPTLDPSVTEAAAPQEASALLDPQEFPAQRRTDAGTPQLSTDELLNKKLDEVREAREANKRKDSEIAMLKKEVMWMKQELRQRAEEVKAMKTSKTAARSAPKKKSAEAYQTR
ncbi:MAG: hypothetical protein AABZ24_08535, partial [Nitrospirota bacterium]